MKKSNKTNQPTFDNKFMQLALAQAKRAFNQNEIPVGCVIVKRECGSIIAKTRNMVEQKKNPNLHAEILAINIACTKLNSKNLSECDIYTTLEPCTMCAAAISASRLGRLYYAASDEKQGAVENGVRFFSSSSCFHFPEVYQGICEEESVNLIKSFFRKLRKNKL